MHTTSIYTKFKEYANVFYPLPAFLKYRPDFGCWKCLNDLPDNWAMKHFIENVIAEKRYKILEDHALILRGNIPCHAVLNEFIAGASHVILKIKFEDGVIWIARIMSLAVNKMKSTNAWADIWKKISMIGQQQWKVKSLPFITLRKLQQFLSQGYMDTISIELIMWEAHTC